ncbi:hypothetical protein ACP0FP_25150, partial [Escherichia coli]|uniref:hypothetical protein n=1 Tax=Escherichia coli TaxID=562 RepID=UPI003CF41807
EKIFTVFGEKVILRSANDTICGGVILNPIYDPMNKNQKRELLKNLYKRDFKNGFKILLEAHKRGLGVVSSTQRFALSHDESSDFLTLFPHKSPVGTLSFSKNF